MPQVKNKDDREQRKREIIRRYKDGDRLSDIASDYGVTPGLVCSFARGAGLRRNAACPRHGRRKHTVNDDYFSVVDSPEKAWLLGFICADGYICGSSSALRIAVKATDREVLEHATRLMESSYPIRDYHYGQGMRGMASSLQWSSRKMQADLATLGVGPRKSLTLKAPELPEHLRGHFWRGVIDGDGSILERKYSGYGNPRWTVSLVGSLGIMREPLCC